VAASYVTTDGTTAPDAFLNSKLAVVIDAAAIGSLKVAVTDVACGRPVAPSPGDTAMTVGATLSGVPTENDQTVVPVATLPATSRTPPVPPLTVAL
jgi:hypothetical protein